MADAFDNSLHTAYRTIKGTHRDKVDLADRRFVTRKTFVRIG